MIELNEDKIRKIVREEYSKAANRRRTSSCCGPSNESEMTQSSSCSSESCGGAIKIPAEKMDEFLQKYSNQLGYTEDELQHYLTGISR